MARHRTCGLLIVALIAGISHLPVSNAYAGTGDEVRIGGYVQIWATAYEQIENGIRQAGSGDEASQVASGFSVRRARVKGQWTKLEGDLTFRIEARFESGVDLTDCYMSLRLSNKVDVALGQMKIPSTYEVLAPTSKLTFIQRSTVSGRIVDWSLSRTPYISPYMGNKASLRDVGLSLKASLAEGKGKVFAMVGNGLGANLFIGGKERKQFIAANSPGDLFYGLRLDIRPVPPLALGGHVSTNKHADALANDEKTVVDLKRWSYSIDAGAELPGGLRAKGLWAGGVIDDDFYRDGKRNYEYSGYEGRVAGWLLQDVLEAALRFDRYRYEFSESGASSTLDTWTVGLNHVFRDAVRWQVNYIHKKLDSITDPELNDNLLLVNVQLVF